MIDGYIVEQESDGLQDRYIDVHHRNIHVVVAVVTGVVMRMAYMRIALHIQ